MPQNVTSISQDELYNDTDSFEDELGIRFDTQGIDTNDGAWIPDIPTQDSKDAPHEERADERSPKERIDDVFHKMGSCRHYLTTVLSCCESPVQSSDIEQALLEVQKYNASVYSTFNICTMLENAGALERTTETGEPYDEQKFEPELVCIDGEEYLKPVPAPAVYWKTTQEGAEKLACFDPLSELSQLYADEPQFSVLYQRILKFMQEKPSGCTLANISEIIDSDPLVQKPRYYAGYFLERLEKCDGVAWKGAWFVTDEGKQFYQDFLAQESQNANTQGDDTHE